LSAACSAAAAAGAAAGAGRSARTQSRVSASCCSANAAGTGSAAYAPSRRSCAPAVRAMCGAAVPLCRKLTEASYWRDSMYRMVMASARTLQPWHQAGRRSRQSPTMRHDQNSCASGRAPPQHRAGAHLQHRGGGGIDAAGAGARARARGVLQRRRAAHRIQRASEQARCGAVQRGALGARRGRGRAGRKCGQSGQRGRAPPGLRRHQRLAAGLPGGRRCSAYGSGSHMQVDVLLGVPGQTRCHWACIMRM